MLVERADVELAAMGPEVLALAWVDACALGVQVLRVTPLALELLERAANQNYIAEYNEEQHDYYCVELSLRSAGFKLSPKE